MKRARCSTCQARVIWATTQNGKRIPINPEPVAGGNIRLSGGDLHPRAAVVDMSRDLFDETDDGARYVSHFVDCPQAAEHRAKAWA